MQAPEASFDGSIYKGLFETTSDLILIADPQGIIVRTNRKAARSFLEGPSVGLPFWTRLGLPCADLKEALALCTPREPGGPAAAAKYVCQATQVSYDLRVVALGEPASDRHGFLLVLREGAGAAPLPAQLERQGRERAQDLARSQKMLQTVFQGVGKGIILVDEDMEVIEANQKACETFGIHPENILGAHICSLCDGSDKEAVLALMDTLVENQVLSAEVTALYFDRSTFPAVFTVSVISVLGSRLWIIITEDIAKRKAMEQQLKIEKGLTEEANIALRNVLKNIQREQADLDGRLSDKIANEVFPVLHKIRSAASEEVRNSYLDFLGELLMSLASGSDPHLDFLLHRLSKTEIKICNFIRAGFSSKEIGATMNLAFDTIQTHRKNIRKKLGLAGSAKTSLHGHLLSQNLASRAMPPAMD